MAPGTRPEQSALSLLESTVNTPANAALEQSPGPSPSEMERFLKQVAAQNMTVIPESALRRIIPMHNGRLSNDMAEALALTEEEVRRVNQVFEEVEEKLNESELERLEIVGASDEEVIFRIPRDIERGRQLNEEFRRRLIEVLGDIDGEFFLNVHDSSYPTDFYFHRFGQIDRTITFTLMTVPNNGSRLGFWEEIPLSQQRGALKGAEGSSRVGFETEFPITSLSPVQPSSPSSAKRSKFLIPLLPEPMRSQFEGLERAAAPPTSDN